MTANRKFKVISGGRPDRAQCPNAPDINESVVLTLPENVIRDFEKRYATKPRRTLLVSTHALAQRATKLLEQLRRKQKWFN